MMCQRLGERSSREEEDLCYNPYLSSSMRTKRCYNFLSCTLRALIAHTVDVETYRVQREKRGKIMLEKEERRVTKGRDLGKPCIYKKIPADYTLNNSFNLCNVTK